MGDVEQTDHDEAGIAQDPAAFEEFYRRYVPEVTRFIARRVDDAYLVGDLTADVFLAVIEYAHTYRPDRGSLIGWVFGVAHRVLAAERRRAERIAHDESQDGGCSTRRIWRTWRSASTRKSAARRLHQALPESD